MPERVRAALFWADFLFLIERIEASESLYERFYRTAWNRNDAVIATRAAAGLLLLYQPKVLYSKDREKQKRLKEERRQLGERTFSRFPRAPAAAFLAFWIAHDTGQGEKGDFAEACEGYRRAYTQYPKSAWAEEAQFYEIFKGVKPGRIEQWQPKIEAFKKRYPDSRRIVSLEWIVGEMKILEEIWRADGDL